MLGGMTGRMFLNKGDVWGDDGQDVWKQGGFVGGHLDGQGMFGRMLG